jgi:hypothetical protein
LFRKIGESEKKKGSGRNGNGTKNQFGAVKVGRQTTRKGKQILSSSGPLHCCCARNPLHLCFFPKIPQNISLGYFGHSAKKEKLFLAFLLLLPFPFRFLGLRPENIFNLSNDIIQNVGLEFEDFKFSFL